ncbi:unnamed protein product [Nippostrongylus brasiliensis]|uniref:Galectin n=1 Tax=Nippostrongylus brasiliensis TaxID=27835 RepID=A0A0N4Y081_NIPBR|nr:unnamed protein product [Nippostrongylus brasiliensis]
MEATKSILISQVRLLLDANELGKSSGLGGMKTQELVSDEGGSSSSEQPGFFPRPSVLPCGPPLNGVTGMTMPTWVHPTPPGAPNDLFVHIQMGETLNILVGNDVQNITVEIMENLYFPKVDLKKTY